MKATGKKEVAEAVLTAVLTTVTTTLATWALERLKANAESKKGKGRRK